MFWGISIRSRCVRRTKSTGKSRRTFPDLERPQGIRVDGADPARLTAAIEAAFVYRGDVTIDRVGDGGRIEGYLFDRREAHDFNRATLRIIPSDGGARVTIPFLDIASIEFSGRDTAAGKSFETWMKKYVEKKLAGQVANLEAEHLDGA